MNSPAHNPTAVDLAIIRINEGVIHQVGDVVLVMRQATSAQIGQITNPRLVLTALRPYPVGAEHREETAEKLAGMSDDAKARYAAPLAAMFATHETGTKCMIRLMQLCAYLGRPVAATVAGVVMGALFKLTNIRDDDPGELPVGLGFAGVAALRAMGSEGCVALLPEAVSTEIDRATADIRSPHTSLTRKYLSTLMALEILTAVGEGIPPTVQGKLTALLTAITESAENELRLRANKHIPGGGVALINVCRNAVAKLCTASAPASTS